MFDIFGIRKLKFLSCIVVINKPIVYINFIMF